MRQIVHKKRPIVQNDLLMSRLSVIAGGRANATIWCGGRGESAWFEWSLKSAIGYLLPTNTPIETMCSAGIVNKILPGEMLVVNRSNSDTFAIRLADVGVTMTLPTQGAVMGHLLMNTSTSAFVDMPSRSMALIKLSTHEHGRLSALSLLVANEIASSSSTDVGPEVIGSGLALHLEKALYALLAEILCACDPLGLPQFAAMADGRIALALYAMTNAPERPWQVASLAKQAALSRTLFATRFKLLLGITPLDYLTQLRVQLAATLAVEDQKLTLHDIAKAVGYADESALRRARLRLGLRFAHGTAYVPMRPSRGELADA
jgi:AraC-like DNA-binding protein